MPMFYAWLNGDLNLYGVNIDMKIKHSSKSYKDLVSFACQNETEKYSGVN